MAVYVAATFSPSLYAGTTTEIFIGQLNGDSK